MMGRRPGIWSEDGIALPVAVLVLAITLVISAYAFASATRSNDQSNADRGVKRALQAADAGLQTAVYRLNKLDAARSAQPCVVVAAGSTDNQLAYAGYDAATPGWCPAVKETLGDGASWSYRVGAPAAGGPAIERTVVATGTEGSATRRVAATVSASGATTPLFGSFAVSSAETLAMADNVQVTGAVRTNGDIDLRANARICGDAIPGPGKQVTYNGTTRCPGYSTTAAVSKFALAPVNQGTAATDNSNGRICVGDPCNAREGLAWDPATRRLRLAQNATLTLGGTRPYSFCKLELDDSAQIVVPAGQNVTIFIDAPENCPGANGAGTLTKLKASQFITLGNDPSVLRIYVVGSSTIATPVTFDTYTEQWLTLYAPLSEVSLRSSFRMNGAVAARRVVLDDGARIVANPAVAAIGGAGVFSQFRSSAFRECVAAASGTAIDRGCAVDLTG